MLIGADQGFYAIETWTRATCGIEGPMIEATRSSKLRAAATASSWRSTSPHLTDGVADEESGVVGG